MMLAGLDEYYWYSQVVTGDNDFMDTPNLVASDVGHFWMSGFFKWMIPMTGAPAPHSIITGQWEPTDEEMDLGITDGFGAVSALLFGATQCGMAGQPNALTRVTAFEALITQFSDLASDPVFDVSKTILSWEANDCAGSSRAAFPRDGDYNSFAQYA